MENDGWSSPIPRQFLSFISDHVFGKIRQTLQKPNQCCVWFRRAHLAPNLSPLSPASAKHLPLPPVKLHYSMLAEDVIKSAVKNYKKNKAFSDPAVLGWCHYGRFPRAETIGEIERKNLLQLEIFIHTSPSQPIRSL
ncbi:hypothetical protein YC2023_067339 [Brassica napus]